MMNRLIVAGCIVLLAAAVACGRSDLFEAAESPQVVVAQRYAPPAEAEPRSQGIAERRLIRIVDLELAVDDTEATAGRIRDLATSLGGYVGSTDARRRQGILSYSMTIHVPADELESAIARIKELASIVDREHLRTEDVTDRIIDLDARLRTLRATETELQALLEDSRASQHGLEDIMAVYRELTRIRSEIEQFLGQLESLEERVSLSTINLVLRPTEAARAVVAERWSPTDLARNSARSLISVLQALAGFAIFFVIVVLPVTVVVAIPVWGIARLWQRSKIGRMGQSPAPTEKMET